MDDIDVGPKVPSEITTDDVGRKPKPQWPKITHEQLAQALRDAGGVQSIAAKVLGLTRSAVSDRVKRSKELQDIILESEGRVTDKAALNIISSIKKGNLTASIFWLKTRAKGEGWSERTEITGQDGGPVLGASYQEWSQLPLKDRIEALKRISQLPRDPAGGED